MTFKSFEVSQVLVLYPVHGIYVICRKNYINTKGTKYLLVLYKHRKIIQNLLKFLDVVESVVNEELCH